MLAGSCLRGDETPASKPQGPQGSAAKGNTAKYDGHPASYWRRELLNQPYWWPLPSFPLIKGGAAAVPVLIELLQDDDDIVRNGAAQCLQSIGPAARPAVPALARALFDKSDRVGIRAAFALADIGPPALEARPSLILVLHDSRYGDEFYAIVARSLWKIGGEAEASLIVPMMQKIIKKRDPDSGSAQCTAAELLGEIGPAAKQTVPDLIRMVQDHTDHSGARMRGCTALGKIGPDARAAVPELQKRLTDEYPGVRVCAAEALSRITKVIEEKWVAMLVEIIHEDRHGVTEAMDVLGEFGPKAKHAVPDLLGILRSKDPDPYHYYQTLKCHAGEALKKIDPKAATAAGVK
jgi:HEAT repeat protein